MPAYHDEPWWGVDAKLRAHARPDLITVLDKYPTPCIDPDPDPDLDPQDYVRPRLENAYDSYEHAQQVGHITYRPRNEYESFPAVLRSLPATHTFVSYFTPMGVHQVEHHREPILGANTFWDCCSREFKDAQLYREYMVNTINMQLLKR